MAHQLQPWLLILLSLFLLTTFLSEPVAAVKPDLFKSCDQSGFCKRNRAYADIAASHGSQWTSPYSLQDLKPLKNGVLTGTITKLTDSTTKQVVRFPLTITFLESGSARVIIDEEKRQKGDIDLRHGSTVRKERSDEVRKWSLTGAGLGPDKTAKIDEDTSTEGRTVFRFGKDGKHEALITHLPFGIEFKRGGETQIALNDRGLMQIEHWRPKTEFEKPTDRNMTADELGLFMVVEEEEDFMWWDENFGGHTDSKPKGPESVALDFTFKGYEHIYGIPEHATPLSLKETRGGTNAYNDPYRMFNSDVFEYDLDSPMTLYGTIPFMQAHKAGSTVGLFWLNAAELWVDVTRSTRSSNPSSMGQKAPTDTHTHWFFESGLVDVFVMLGPTPADISKTYGELTGFTQLPQLFAIGYHQCRWNYVTDQDVRDVDKKFDRHNIPYDVIWLDIDYLDDKRFFLFDPLTFSDPIGMQTQLDVHQRKLVTIIDPHIKKVDGYFVHDEMKSKELAVRAKDNKELWEGHCWPGASHWIDCFNPAAIEWWKSLFHYDRYKGSMHNTFVWNDMNEPSVFNGPEHSMPRDNVHHGGWEHRDVHNVNGLTFHNATFAALDVRDDTKAHKTPTKRPFSLTRSFFAGSQRVGATWTGDNQAHWSHLKQSIPMVLNQGISGFPFAGADVTGFMGNPSLELQARWYQTGAFYPFFRAHSHIDTRRREPYLATSPYKEVITQAIRLRYSLLPAWYTAFHAASTDGTPIVKPLWWEYPWDAHASDLDLQMVLGDTGLMIAPVLDEGATTIAVYFPSSPPGGAFPSSGAQVASVPNQGTPYYDYLTYTVYHAGASSNSGRIHRLDAPLEKIPLFMRAGHIFPRRERPRRSTGLMRFDPVTLVVVLDPAAFTSASGSGESGGTEVAVGTLYLDDGESYTYQKGARIHRRFRMGRDGALVSEDADEHVGSASSSFKKVKEEYAKSMDAVVVEKVVLVGAPKEWKGRSTVQVDGTQNHEADFEFHEGSTSTADWAIVKKPGVAVGRDWRIHF